MFTPQIMNQIDVICFKINQTVIILLESILMRDKQTKIKSNLDKHLTTILKLKFVIFPFFHL